MARWILIQGLKAPIRQWISVSRSAIWKLAEPLHLELYATEFEAQAEPLGAPPLAGSSIVRLDASDMSETKGLDAEHLRQGRLCYRIVLGDDVAHESWLTFTSRMPALFGYDHGVPVIGDCLTEERYRGRGLYPYMLRYIVHDCYKRGLRGQVFIFAAAANASSLRGIRSAGFRYVGPMEGRRITALMKRAAPHASRLALRRLPRAKRNV